MASGARQAVLRVELELGCLAEAGLTSLQVSCGPAPAELGLPGSLGRRRELCRQSLGVWAVAVAAAGLLHLGTEPGWTGLPHTKVLTPGGFYFAKQLKVKCLTSTYRADDAVFCDLLLQAS